MCLGTHELHVGDSEGFERLYFTSCETVSLFMRLDVMKGINFLHVHEKNYVDILLTPTRAAKKVDTFLCIDALHRRRHQRSQDVVKKT